MVYAAHAGTVVRWYAGTLVRKRADAEIGNGPDCMYCTVLELFSIRPLLLDCTALAGRQWAHVTNSRLVCRLVCGSLNRRDNFVNLYHSSPVRHPRSLAYTRQRYTLVSTEHIGNASKAQNNIAKVGPPCDKLQTSARRQTH